MDGVGFSSSSAISAVFRDSNGRMVSAYARPGLGFAHPEVVEAVRVPEALSWLRERRKGCMLVETDCLRVVQAIQATSIDNSSFGLLLQDCKFLLSTLDNVRVVHAKRSTNMVAHNIAQAASAMSDRHVWGFTPPQCILASLAFDLN